MQKIMPPLFKLALLLCLLPGCIGDDIIEDQIEATVRITNPIDTLGIGDSHQFTATFFNEIGLAETASFLWESNDPQIIEISSGGLATGVATGNALIRVQVDREGIIYRDSLEVATGTETVASSTTRSGTLETTSSYLLEGSFALEDTGSGLILKLGSDYRASSSLPGLYVYLSNNITGINNALEIGPVNIFSGATEFNIPGNPGLNDYEYVLFWCKPFGVDVGVGYFDN